MPGMDEIYTLEQAADKLQVTERYVRDQIAAGTLKAYKRGKRIYVLHSDLIAYIQAGKDAADKTGD